MRECYLDHFVAMRLRISSRHGKDSDLLRLGATVSQRQGHLPVGGAVCGVGPGNTEDHQCHIYGSLTHCVSTVGVSWPLAAC